MKECIVLVCVILFAIFMVSCDETTLKGQAKERAKDVPLQDMSEAPVVPILYSKDQLDAIRQQEKLEANRATRDKLNWGKGIAIALVLIGGIASFILPSGTRKWGIGAGAAGVALLVIFSALSYYLELFNLIVLIIILVSILLAAICGIMWARAHGFFSHVVNSNQKTKKLLAVEHPVLLEKVKDLWEKENKDIADQVRAVKK